MTKSLTPPERSALYAREEILEKHLPTVRKADAAYIAVGKALEEIRDQRLYRAEFDRFADYCLEKWDLSEAHVTRLIQASQAASALPVGKAPKAERQARELAKAPPELQTAVMDAANTGGKPTASRIQTLIAKVKSGNLTPEAQRQILEEEQERAKSNAPPHVHGIQNERVLRNSGLRHLRKGLKDFRRIGPEADETIELTEKAIAAAEAMPLAA